VIVTCEQCATQFQLDDSKVPDGGIRVRCSRCKCAFFVESVRRPDADCAKDLAQEALAQDRTAVADGESWAPGSEDDESDWQFNEEITQPPDPGVRPDDAVADPEQLDDLAAAREAVDDLLGSSFAEPVDPVLGFDSGLDLGSSDLEIDYSGSAALGGVGAKTDLPVEPEQDPNAVTLGRAVPPKEPGEAAPEEGGLDVGPDLEIGEVSDSSLPDLGRPEGWELFAEADDSVARSEGSPIGRISPPLLTEAETASETPEPVRRAADDLAFEANAEDAARFARIARVRIAVGWAAVCLLCAYAVVVGLGHRFWVSQPARASLSIAGLDAGGIQGSWIENAVAGPIYVVSGDLRAASSTSTPGGSLLRIRLLDAAGTPIAAESAAVGPRVPAEQVRERNLWDLRQVQEAGAPRMAGEPFAPGERRPFLAVLGSLPPSAVAFEFQAAEAASLAPEVGDGADLAYPEGGLGADGVIE
jgi:predicted Zn finger-like uncharacterized protein